MSRCFGQQQGSATGIGAFGGRAPGDAETNDRHDEFAGPSSCSRNPELTAGPLFPAFKRFQAFLLLLAAAAAAGNAQAQSTPELTVSISDEHILEGQSATLTFRLSQAATENTGFCFFARSTSGRADWNLSAAEPTGSAYVEVNGTILSGTQQTVVTLTTSDNGTNDSANEQELLQFALGDTYGTPTCSANYTLDSGKQGGTISLWDAHDYYETIDVSVRSDATSIYEGQSADFTVYREGGWQARAADENSSGVYFGPNELELPVKLRLTETGYVFLGYIAPWRVQGNARYTEVGTWPTFDESIDVTIPAGDENIVVEVDTQGDAVPDAADTAIALSVLPGTAPYGIGTDSSVSIGVTDAGPNDSPEVRFHGQLTDASVSESDGWVYFSLLQKLTDAPVDLQVRIALDGDFFGAAPTIQIGAYDDSNNSISSARTVTPTTLESGELETTIPYAEHDARRRTVRVLRVQLVDDEVNEAGGSVTLTVPPQMGAAQISATAAVEDDDLPVVTMTVSENAVDEGDSVTLTLTRDGDLSRTLTIRATELHTSTQPNLASDVTQYPIEFAENADTATLERYRAGRRRLYRSQTAQCLVAAGLELRISRSRSGPCRRLGVQRRPLDRVPPADYRRRKGATDAGRGKFACLRVRSGLFQARRRRHGNAPLRFFHFQFRSGLVRIGRLSGFGPGNDVLSQRGSGRRNRKRRRQLPGLRRSRRRPRGREAGHGDA